jgi:hypothetical protein
VQPPADELVLNTAPVVPFRERVLKGSGIVAPPATLNDPKDLRGTPMKLRNLLVAATGLAIVAGAATTASAYENTWQRHHPYRVQVNHRITNLNRSINEERREGDINAAQAARLHTRVHSIRMQEQHIAANHGSHIGLAGQARLNREENGVRRVTPG